MVLIQRYKYCASKVVIFCTLTLGLLFALSRQVSDREHWYSNVCPQKHRWGVGLADNGFHFYWEAYLGNDAEFAEFKENHSQATLWTGEDCGWRTELDHGWRDQGSHTPTWPYYEKWNWASWRPCSNAACLQQTTSCNTRLLIIPFWVIQLPAGLILAIVFLVRWYRFNPTACRKCAFDLRDNISGICPECGTPLSKLNQMMIDASSK